MDIQYKQSLKGKIVLLTGGGGGIGFEAAKAFIYMGATVIIAEINIEKGKNAEKYLNVQSPNSAIFYEIDLSDEKQIYRFKEYIITQYGCPDIIINNATMVKIGAVDEVNIAFWDKSYAVNLKAPLLLANLFLPYMKKNNAGTLVFVSSSGAAPYMGAYEVFKTSQVELSNTLAMELEKTNIYTYTIGPGLVKTETAMNSIKIVANSMKMSVDEFYEMNENHILDVQNAGLGFALSVLNAEKYHGQEISSIQVLNDFDITSESNKTTEVIYKDVDIDKVKIYLIKITDTLKQQHSGWKAMNIFERQWVFRDFKKSMGISAEQAENKLIEISSQSYSSISFLVQEKSFFTNLSAYWNRQLKLLQGYEKDKNRLIENSSIIQEWISDIDYLLFLLK